jgi:hypothetical protein
MVIDRQPFSDRKLHEPPMFYLANKDFTKQMLE